MSREPRPNLVRCANCRTDVRPFSDAHEVVIVVSPEKGGTLGGAYHVTRTGVWLCRRPCATANPFDASVIARLREHLTTRPRAAAQGGLLGGM